MNRRLSVALTAFGLCACGARSALLVDGRADAAAPDVLAAPDVVALPDVVPPRDVPVVLDLPPGTVAVCGNGRVEPGEACDLGALNRLVPAFQVSQLGIDAFPIRPVVRAATVAGFYDYRSASAHTGYEVARTANAMVFASSLDSALSLVFVAGVDTAEQPDGDVQVTFVGAPAGTGVAVSDDNDEFRRDGAGNFVGRWNFGQNTDGGAIGGLPWAVPWRIAIRAEYRGGISAVRVVDGRSGAIGVPTAPELVIEHFTAPTACRPDCRAPRCGDGFLDGGERCDDGNTAGGDGCGADCIALR